MNIIFILIWIWWGALILLIPIEAYIEWKGKRNESNQVSQRD